MDTKLRGYRYPIYPTDQQRTQIIKTFGCVRMVYNMGLEMREGLYKAGMASMSVNTLNNYCNRYLKRHFDFLRDVDKFSLTNSIINLDRAYEAFFAGYNDHPKFKSKKNRNQSYTTNATNGNIELRPGTKKKHGQVKLPKLGWVDVALHRMPPEGSTIKSATVSTDARGKFFVSILFKEPAYVLPPVVPAYETTLGLDYSSPHFYVDSNGDAADMPHWYRKAEKRLGREQRRMSRMKKGSNNYEKQRRKVALLNERVANRRRDFCHKLSRKIANSYDAVCVEDIDLQAMAQSLRFGKATNDNGFGMFRTFLRYKLEEQGKHYVVIDKWFPSTKTCHYCGGYNPDVKLGMDTWVCPHCGRLVDRDPNAAENIKVEGLRQLLAELAA